MQMFLNIGFSPFRQAQGGCLSIYVLLTIPISLIRSLCYVVFLFSLAVLPSILRLPLYNVFVLFIIYLDIIITYMCIYVKSFITFLCYFYLNVFYILFLC